MKLEYLDDISDNGKYPWADPDKLIRLYDFEQTEATQLSDIIRSHLIDDQKPLDLSTIDFITPMNCKLTLEVSEEDHGIDMPEIKNDFVCKLTTKTYIEMLGYMAAFTKNENDLSGYNWLYDPKMNKIDLLFSPGGSW